MLSARVKKCTRKSRLEAPFLLEVRCVITIDSTLVNPPCHSRAIQQLGQEQMRLVKAGHPPSVQHRMGNYTVSSTNTSGSILAGSEARQTLPVKGGAGG